MPDLIDAGPSPLLVAGISIAMISLIVSQLKTISNWALRPLIISVPLLQRSAKLRRINDLHIAFVVMGFYALSHVLGIICLLLGEKAGYIDNLVVLLLLSNASMIIIWLGRRALFMREPVRKPLEIPVDS